MAPDLRNRYIKGVFALGLAFSLSNIYSPLLAEKTPRQERRAIRFDVDEINHKLLANESAHKIKHHINYAIYHSDLSKKDRLKHLEIAKEIIHSVKILMPQMQLMDKLNRIRNSNEEKNGHQFHYIVDAMIKRSGELSNSLPEFSSKLKQGLQEYQFAVKNNKDQFITTQKLSHLYLNLSAKTAYIPLNYIESKINKMEVILSENNVSQKELFSAYDKVLKHLC